MKILTGSRYAKPDAGALRPSTPACPSWLPVAARKWWRPLVRVLEPMRVLTRADGDVMARYCVAKSGFVEATTKLAEEGAVVKAPSGYAVPSAWLPVQKMHAKEMETTGSQLGLSPVARERLRVAPEPEADEVAEFLRQGKRAG